MPLHQNCLKIPPPLWRKRVHKIWSRKYVSCITSDVYRKKVTLYTAHFQRPIKRKNWAIFIFILQKRPKKLIFCPKGLIKKKSEPPYFTVFFRQFFLFENLHTLWPQFGWHVPEYVFELPPSPRHNELLNSVLCNTWNIFRKIIVIC